MKFGLNFTLVKVAEWDEFYLNYSILKKLLSPYNTLTKSNFKYILNQILFEDYVRIYIEDNTLALTNFTANELEGIHKFAGYFEKLLFHEYNKVKN